MILFLAGCNGLDLLGEDDGQAGESGQQEVTDIDDLTDTDHFRHGALEHILEGEINRKGQAVGFHYSRLPSKKGEILDGTETDPDEQGVYEAQVEVEGVAKKSNRGFSTFFPDEWDSQDVVDAINEAYEASEWLSGNTYQGLSKDGVTIQMYLDEQERIISAFPVYEGD